MAYNVLEVTFMWLFSSFVCCSGQISKHTNSKSQMGEDVVTATDTDSNSAILILFFAVGTLAAVTILGTAVTFVVKKLCKRFGIMPPWMNKPNDNPDSPPSYSNCVDIGIIIEGGIYDDDPDIWSEILEPPPPTYESVSKYLHCAPSSTETNDTGNDIETNDTGNAIGQPINRGTAQEAIDTSAYNTARNRQQPQDINSVEENDNRITSHCNNVIDYMAIELSTVCNEDIGNESVIV